MCVSTRRVLIAAAACSASLAYAGPTWQKITLSSGGGGSSAPSFNCVSVITTYKSVTASDVALIANTTIYYTLVGGGGGGGYLNAGANASPSSGSFTIGAGNGVTIYVGGGAG